MKRKFRTHDCGHGFKGRIITIKGITFCQFCGAQKIRGRWLE